MESEAPGAAAAGSPAARLRRLRASLDLSQEQLARRLGVSFATVNRWETGRTRMSARAARALAEFETEVTAQNAGTAQDGGSSTGGGDGSGTGGASAGRGPAGGAASGSLPVAHSSFVGRAHELAELTGLLGRARLLTLTGPGGVGKTRLAAEAIHRWNPPEPVVFVPLEPLRDPESLIPMVASCLRVRDRPGVGLLACLEADLATASRLLVLDGAEHLRDEVAALVGRLLTAAPGLRIIVTSRVVLGVPGEVCWAVPPLACPSAAAPVSDVVSSDAVQLFMARAAERLPGFTATEVAPRAIAELCRGLDSLPLAIELIAGWVGTLSVREILDQGAALLQAEPPATVPSGRTLHGVVRTSYFLLRSEQRRLLPALSVFAAPFTISDASAVSGIRGLALARAIRGLVDSSWLVVDRGEHNRFSMLETMRAFAADRLDELDEGTVVRQRHASHFASMASGSEQGLAGPDADSWTARLEAALADLDAALRWADDSGDLDLGLEMSAALWRWWLTSGRLAVGRDWLSRFLSRAGQRRDELAGRAVCSAAVLAAENGDFPEAVRQARLALEIFDALGLAERSAFAATVLGSAHRYLGDRTAARHCFGVAMDLRTRLGDRRGVSVALNNLALLALDDGDLARARDMFEQALVIKRQLGERHSLALGLANLSDVLIRTGQLEAARRALREAAELAAGLGNPQLIGVLRCSQGDLAARQQRWREAAEHYRAGALAHEQGGHAHDVVTALIGMGRAAHRLGHADEAARHLRAAESLAAGIANPQGLADVRAALTEIGESTTAGALPGGLTARQAEVLQLLAAGLSNKQIAAQLHLSPATVERHLATVYRKLSLGGRVEAARYAVTHGLATPTPLSGVL